MNCINLTYIILVKLASVNSMYIALDFFPKIKSYFICVILIFKMTIYTGKKLQYFGRYSINCHETKMAQTKISICVLLRHFWKQNFKATKADGKIREWRGEGIDNRRLSRLDSEIQKWVKYC